MVAHQAFKEDQWNVATARVYEFVFAVCHDVYSIFIIIKNSVIRLITEAGSKGESKKSHFNIPYKAT